MGIVPALQTSRVDHRQAMQHSGRGVLGTRSRVRSMLVASEVCLAFVLTVVSGLLLKSLVRAWSVDPGFTAQSLYEVNFTLIGANYGDEKAVVRAQTETLRASAADFGHRIGKSSQHAPRSRRLWWL